MKYKMEKFDDLTLNINISKVYDRIDWVYRNYDKKNGLWS